MLTRLNVVGISGQAGAGKDEVAKRLVSHHQFVQISLADPLKRFASQVFAFSDTQLWGPSEHRNKHDKRYTSYGQKTGIDAGWLAATGRLLTEGKVWLAEVTHTVPDTAEFKEHYSALIHWFHWLGQNYPKLSPRVCLQSLGTEMGRDRIHQDIWINHGIDIAKHLLEEHPVSAHYHYQYDRKQELVAVPVPQDYRGVVFSDIRFTNELAAVKACGGFLVKVSRSQSDLLAQAVGVAGHASEAEQVSFGADQFNMIINNEGSLDDLYAAVDVVGTLMEKR